MTEMNEYGRTADEKIYLENRYEEPKEMMKQIAQLLELNTNKYSSKNFSLLDIGAATGEFLYYIRKINKEIQLDGIEYSDKLVNNAKLFLSNMILTLGKEMLTI